MSNNVSISKNSILWVAVGETGGKIVSEIAKQDKRYVSLYINTSYADVKKIPNAKNTFIIPNASGTGRQRSVAKEYAREHFTSIIDAINNFPSQQIINLVFSLSGGTGSGLAPTIARLLTKMQSNKIINIVGVLPSLDEPKRALENSLECWNDIYSVEGINTMYFLDNNKRKNVEQINEEFAKGYNAFMNVTNTNGNGTVIDNADLGRVALAKGCSAFYLLPEDEEDTKIAMAKAFKNSIFADFNSVRCSYLCASLQEDKFDTDLIKNEFRPREEFFKGSNPNDNIVVASGVKPPMGAIELLQLSLQEKIAHEDDEDDSMNNYIVNLNIEKKPQSKKVEQVKVQSQKEPDLDKLFDDDFWENEVF
jgi:cell division GTPase FtsZ